MSDVSGVRAVTSPVPGCSSPVPGCLPGFGSVGLVCAGGGWGPCPGIAPLAWNALGNVRREV